MKSLFNKTICILLCAVLAAAVFAGCRGGKNGADPTSAPDSTDYTDVYVSDNPSSTEGAAVTPGPDGSYPPVETPGPDESSSPDQTPEPTKRPGTSSTHPPIYTTPLPTTPPTEGVLTGLVWIDGSRSVLYDMDSDGKAERIEISSDGSTVSVSIGSGSNGSVFRENISADEMMSAVINDFNSGDGRAELIVSTVSGSRGHRLSCLRLNSGSNGLDKFTVDGWIDEVGTNGIVIGRMIDIMGTWDCTAEFTFSSDSFGLVQASELWTVKRPSERWCTVSSDNMLVCYYTTGPDNEVGFLDYGCRMYPTSTDLSTIINVTLDTGAACYLSVTIGPDGLPKYSGADMTEWFSDLTFIW